MLDPQQFHHARTVLRLVQGDHIELFDREGRSAIGVIHALEPILNVQIDTVEQPARGTHLVVASAVPKGDRADWMVEKLSEIGVSHWIPLRTERSVVHPEGKSKLDRWRRIADESAKQCKRIGVMEIGELVLLSKFLDKIDAGVTLVLSTADNVRPIHGVLDTSPGALLIGPEGGWTADEEKSMRDRGLTPVTLGRTILRVETAAIVAAGIIASREAKP